MKIMEDQMRRERDEIRQQRENIARNEIIDSIIAQRDSDCDNFTPLERTRRYSYYPKYNTYNNF